MSSELASTGLYGKLPAHGDFIYRNLPTRFVNVWDEWLQQYVFSSQELLGDEWLNLFLVSPVWRFVLSEGVVDEYAWAGVMMPSVDRVGRYFPFSLIRQLPSTTGPCAFLSSNTEWFESMEEYALQALGGQLVLEQLVEDVNKVGLKPPIYIRQQAVAQPNNIVIDTSLNNGGQKNDFTSSLPVLLDAQLKQSMTSYSAWSTVGSEHVEACTFVHKNLPAASGVAAMLDGQWHDWRWQQPFQLVQ